jgi:uncharacterized SAM-binding protein YcdF (DUF218 family)
LLSIVKTIGPPGSVRFAALCLAIGLTLTFIWPRRRRIARGWFIAVFAGHVLLSLPVVANGIARQLSEIRPADPTSMAHIETLVVFDGDNRRGRVQETTRVFGIASPVTVWVYGGDWMLYRITESGIPKPRIKQNSGPRNTRTQMIGLERLVAEKPDARVALIVSRLQMARVAGMARKAGLQVLLIPSPIDTEPPTTGWRLFVPTYIALRVSRDAVYEHAALAYYRWQGWA